MASANTPPAPSNMIITIIPDHDLIIALTIIGQAIRVNGELRHPKTVTHFNVKEKVINDMPSVVKRDLKTFPKHRNPLTWRFIRRDPGDNLAKIEIESDWGTALAFEIIMRIFHDTINQSCLDAELREFWYIANLCDYLGIDAVPTRPFFATWYDRREVPTDYGEWRYLLFPLWYFDHAEGFLEITELLVYNATSHIDDRNPTKVEVKVPRLILNGLNGARGRLKTIFSRELWKPCASLLELTCKCAPQTFFDFSKSLVDAKVWPIEDVLKVSSINGICDRAKKYKFSVHASACVSCRMENYGAIVRGAGLKTEDEFDGLCLSCIEHSKDMRFDRSDLDDNELLRYGDGNFDKHCDVNHGQMSWYWSYNARPEYKQRMTKRIVSRHQ